MVKELFVCLGAAYEFIYKKLSCMNKKGGIRLLSNSANNCKPWLYTFKLLHVPRFYLKY